MTAVNAGGTGEPGEVPELLEVDDRTSKSTWMFCCLLQISHLGCSAYVPFFFFLRSGLLH